METPPHSPPPDQDIDWDVTSLDAREAGAPRKATYLDAQALINIASENRIADFEHLLRTQEYPQDAKSQALVELSYLGSTEFVRLLIRYGGKPDVHLQGYDGTALHFAARHGHIDILKLFAEDVADIDRDDSYGTPLMWAAGYGQILAMEFLISKGARVNDNETSDSPLVWAAENGKTEAIHLLVNKGATINDMNGTGALESARAGGYTDTVHLLTELMSTATTAPLLDAASCSHGDCAHPP
ncbi:ankyrin repeat-containing domain protein [Xylariales sp. PMI_506]|nr:ankyrin repeat-containing domain protein [Xylariales sp. PMI_506]